MKPRTIAIIQARMSSSRLPGKVLLDINGEPMLAHVIERAKRAKLVDEVVLATTTDLSDNPVAEFCAERGYNFTRGSLHDVLDRYYQAAKEHNAEIIVRLTADCPVLDPDIVDETIESREKRVESSGFDFVANRLPPPMGRTFPIGLDTEVCTFAALKNAWQNATEKHQREHVMPYLYEDTNLKLAGLSLSKSSTLNLQTGISPRGFKIALLNHVPDYGNLRWTVDTPEDLEFIRQIFVRFDNNDFGWHDILSLLEKEPNLAKINADVHHKTLLE